MTNPISHRAVLVSLNLRAWKGTATDREVAAQAELNSSAEQGTMTVIKKLTPDYVISPIKTIMTRGRQEHYRMTSPGLIQGQHLLATSMFEEYHLTQGAYRDKFEEVVDEFLGIYPKIRATAQSKRLGTAFKDSDFPTVDGIRSYFDYKFTVSPVPEATDWRLDGVDPKALSEMRAEIEDGVAAMYRKAHEELFTRTKLLLEAMISQAKGWSTTAPGAMLRDASIANWKEMISIVQAMNVTGDPVIDKIGQELQQFADLSGEELRRSQESRNAVADKASKILAKMVSAKKPAVRRAA